MPDLQERAQAALGDRYRIERELGRGGMATVFLAEDRKHQRLVALKILHPDIASNIGADRFRREIEFAAHLNHPHILPLIDSGEDGGLLWFAMPYVEGESLRHRLERMGKLSLSEAAEIARQTATALDYAHGQGVLHRDIKPENLMLAHDHVWVGDFGIARAIRQSETADGTGTFVVGTPAYMSPEQGRGEDHLDGRSDVYSLATVVYETLAGTAPFKGDTPGKIFTRREVNPPAPIRTIRPDLPAAAATAVHRGLALDPKDRQATAGTFAAELAGAVPSPHVARAARRASWLTLVAASLAVAAAGLAYWWISRPPAWDDRRILILPLEGQQNVVEGFGVDLANTVETQLALTGILLPKSVANEFPLSLGVPLADSVVNRLQRSYRSRYVVAVRISRDDSLRLAITLAEAGRLLAAPRRHLVTMRVGASSWDAALEVSFALLPYVLPSGGSFDRDLVLSRSIEARTSYQLGERAYRSGRFALADTLFSRALDLDSTFGWAALRAAQAASWNQSHARALAMIDRGEPYLGVLGPRVVSFAAGLKAYQLSMADSAVSSLRRALAEDPQWVEAWMALGEVYHHLLPSDGRPIERATEAFDSARYYDPTFSAPVFHQIQQAVWDLRHSDADSLTRLLDSLWRSSEEKTTKQMLARAGLMGAACFPRAARTWAEFADSHVRDTMVQRGRLSWERDAAIDLAGGGLQQAGCAVDGLDHILKADKSDRLVYALTALAFVQAARGRPDSVAMLLQHPEFQARHWKEALAHMFAVADLPTIDLAETKVPEITSGDGLGPDIPTTTRGVREAWAFATWQIRNRQLEPAAATESILRRIAASPDSATPAEVLRLADLYGRSLRARRLLAQGDTARARAILEGLVPNADQGLLRWQPWEALAWERYHLALLYEANGEWRRAFNLAEGFDSPASYGLLLYLPQSLELRIRLAGRLGLFTYQRRLEERLAALRSQ